jgi:hypothetical protein
LRLGQASKTLRLIKSELCMMFASLSPVKTKPGPPYPRPIGRLPKKVDPPRIANLRVPQIALDKIICRGGRELREFQIYPWNPETFFFQTLGQVAADKSPSPAN